MESTQVRNVAQKLSKNGNEDKKSKVVHQTNSETDSSISLTFDSASDYGYKSGDLSATWTGSKDKNQIFNVSEVLYATKSEQSIRFDSGLGADCFSPVSSEDFSPEENQKTTTGDKKSPPSELLWQDIFSQDQDGDMVLHLAIVEARSDVIFPLIRLAPHPDFLDICNDLCQTLLHLAALTGKSNIVRRLIVVGATVDIPDHSGNTALHIASRNGDLDCVQAILEPITVAEVKEVQCLYQVFLQAHNLSHIINMKNFDGQTCVHLAALGGFKKVLECLYDHGGDVNNQDGKSGKTSLHYGIENSNYDLVSLLLTKCHANPRMKNYAGQTSLHIAWTLSKRNSSKVLPKMFLDLLLKNFDNFEPPSDSENECSSSDEKEIAKLQNEISNVASQENHQKL